MKQVSPPPHESGISPTPHSPLSVSLRLTSQDPVNNCCNS
jgi:hypothetical protein